MQSARTRTHLASVAMMPVAETFRHDPVLETMGVQPRFPQVLRTTGRSEYPDSSKKHRVALRRAPFLATVARCAVATVGSAARSSPWRGGLAAGRKIRAHAGDARQNEDGTECARSAK